MDRSDKSRPDEDDTTLFRSARKAAGVSIGDLAKKCNVSGLTLKRIENGKKPKLRIETINKIIDGATNLGIEVNFEKVFPEAKPTIYDPPLKILRINLRMSQVNLAEKLRSYGCQVTNSHICAMESGKKPGRQLATDMVRALKLIGDEKKTKVEITEMELLYPEHYMKKPTAEIQKLPTATLPA